MTVSNSTDKYYTSCTFNANMIALPLKDHGAKQETNENVIRGNSN